jgi:putative transposase
VIHQLWEFNSPGSGQEEELTTMKRHRHTPEQVVRKLREGDRLLNEGKDLAEVLRHLEVSEATWNRWRNQYGGMKATEAKRLKELEHENARLKKLLAEAELDKSMLKELAEGNF